MNSSGTFPKISVITAVHNRSATVGAAIESVLGQTWPNVEYILIDGMSNDGTDDVIRSYGDRIDRSIREPDEGIYDALNKGIRAATGDVVGFLHADDLLASPDVLESIAREFQSGEIDGVYGGLYYVNAQNPDRIVRYWKPVPYKIGRFWRGWMPPHPTCYLRRECYLQHGLFNRSMSIAADYELLVRMMVRYRIRVSSIDRVLVRMRVGGKSNASLRNRLLANREDVEAWRINGLRPPLGLRFTKPARKLLQFLAKPE